MRSFARHLHRHDRHDRFPDPARSRRTAGLEAPDPRLDRALRRLVLLGLALVLALPAARGSSAWLGALPLWLVAMPLASWWALHRFRLPGRGSRPGPGVHRRRRGGVQARRRAPAVRAASLARRAA